MQPPDRDDKEAYPPFLKKPPKTGIPKTIGILNIIFGSLLLLCTICIGLSLAMQFAMGPMVAGQQQQMQQIMEAERNDKLQELQIQELAAQDEKEKAAIQAQQKALKAQPVPRMPNMALFTEDVGFQAYGIADVVTGLILNLLMVISGIGLVGYKNWGRLLGLWVAFLKIVRLVVLYGFFIVVIVPDMTKAFISMFQEMADEMAKAGPPGKRIPVAPGMDQMGTYMGIMYTAFAVAMIVLGVIYPIIVLILLSKRRVKDACASMAMEPGQMQRE